MNIEIVEIKDRGNKSKERLVLKAKSNIDIGYYIVFLTQKTGADSFASTPESTYWFPDRKVQEGDLIVLYTKTGKDSSTLNKSGSTSYFFYWGLNSPAFKEEKKMPVVIEAKGWT